MTDIVRVNMGNATEDVQFLDDQLGPRLQAMSNKVEEEFARRKAAILKRKASFVPQCSSLAMSPSNDDVNDEDTEEETDHGEEDDDEDYVATTRREKRSDMIKA